MSNTTYVEIMETDLTPYYILWSSVWQLYYPEHDIELRTKLHELKVYVVYFRHGFESSTQSLSTLIEVQFQR